MVLSGDRGRGSCTPLCLAKGNQRTCRVPQGSHFGNPASNRRGLQPQGLGVALAVPRVSVARCHLQVSSRPLAPTDRSGFPWQEKIFDFLLLLLNTVPPYYPSRHHWRRAPEGQRCPPEMTGETLRLPPCEGKARTVRNGSKPPSR